MKEFSDEKDQKKAKWKMVINSWMGDRTKVGEWVSESVATNNKRTFERHTRGADSTKSKPVIVKQQCEELIHMHHGYRPHIEGEKKTRKAFFFRGARIWRTA